MPRRLPLDVPIPVRVSPRVLFALETCLADPVTADRFEACLYNQGVEEDATEDAYDHLRATIRRALDDASNRNGATPIDGRQHRHVVRPGGVRINGALYTHPDLVCLIGEPVVCLPTPLDGGTAARIQLLDGTFVCIAALASLEAVQADTALAA